MPEKPKSIINYETQLDLPVEFTEEEMNAIAATIFKSDKGAVNRAVKFYTNQNKLNGYQKILLAPANAFEGLINFGVDVFSGKAANDISLLIKNISDEKTRNMLTKTIKKGWENCSREEKIAFVTEFICTALITVGAFNKLKTIIPAEKLVLLEKFTTTRRLKNLSAAIIASPVDEGLAVSAPIVKSITKNRSTKD